MFIVTTLLKIPLLFAVKTGEQCNKGTIPLLKPWYQYLTFDDECKVMDNTLDQPNNLWLIGAVIFEDLLRIAALVAVGYVIAGGFKMMTSQGEPQAFAAGRKTAINALIGMAIAIIASQTVAYIAGRLT